MTYNMAKTIFLSWQNDTPPKIGRFFLKDALDEACKQITADAELTEADRDVVADSDTQGVPGHPPVMSTILEKIDAAAVFVADITFTGTVDGGSKRTPNPNVLIEYGWAWKTLARRMVCVMNVAHGHPETEPLPFDLGHLRWPILFNLPADASKETMAAEKKKLVGVLKKAITSCLAEVPAAPSVSPPKFPEAAPGQGQARFRKQGQMLGVTWDAMMPFKLRPEDEVFLADGAAMWLRVMPTVDPGRMWAAEKMYRNAIRTGDVKLDPFYSGGIGQLRAEDGIGICGSIDEHRRTSTVAFAFQAGEVWSVDTGLLAAWSEHNLLPAQWIQEEYPKYLLKYATFLQAIGIEGPYRWIAGLDGVKGRLFQIPSRPNSLSVMSVGGACMADVIVAEGVYDHTKLQPQVALRPFFEAIYLKCGYEFPRTL